MKYLVKKKPIHTGTEHRCFGCGLRIKAGNHACRYWVAKRSENKILSFIMCDSCDDFIEKPHVEAWIKQHITRDDPYYEGFLKNYDAEHKGELTAFSATFWLNMAVSNVTGRFSTMIASTAKEWDIHNILMKESKELLKSFNEIVEYDLEKLSNQQLDERIEVTLSSSREDLLAGFVSLAISYHKK